MRVALAIPAYGDVRYETARSLWRLTSFLTAQDVIYDELAMVGDPDIARARNAILSGFLASKADRLLFIDTDIGFDFKDAWRLLRADVDYVGANYPRKQLGGGWASTPKRGGEVRGSLVEAEMLATGLLSLSRKCVDAMAQGAPRFVSNNGHDYVAVAIAGPVDGRWVLEDEAMCRRWQSLGGKAWIDTSIRCTHSGQHTFTCEDA